MPVFYHFKDGTVSLNPSTTGTINYKVPQKRRGNIKDILQFVYCKKEPTVRGILRCRGHDESGLFVRNLTVEMRTNNCQGTPVSLKIFWTSQSPTTMWCDDSIDHQPHSIIVWPHGRIIATITIPYQTNHVILGVVNTIGLKSWHANRNAKTLSYPNNYTGCIERNCHVMLKRCHNPNSTQSSMSSAAPKK